MNNTRTDSSPSFSRLTSDIDKFVNNTLLDYGGAKPW